MEKHPTRILEEFLAPEGRRVLADWRAGVLIRRAIRQGQQVSNALKRDSSTRSVRRLLERLSQAGEFEELEECPHLFLVKSPYALGEPIQEWEVLMEAHPLAAFSHDSALVFHRLTETFPQTFHLILPVINPDWLPIGTDDRDWDNEKPPKGRRPETIFGKTVYWHKVKETRGVQEYRPFGYPVRVTTPARTLLDGLLEPSWCGGIENVFRAWASSKDTLDLPAVLDLVDTFDKSILRQRAGFVLEALGFTSPRIEAWQSKISTGGSSRLLASEAFDAIPGNFSEKWRMAINVPTATLTEGWI